STWFAARGQSHDVDRVHQISYVAAETEEADVVHDASFFGDLVEFAPQFALADDPELGLWQFAEHSGHRGEQVDMALLARKVSESADDRGICFGAAICSNKERIARCIEIVRGHCVVEHGKSLGRNSLIHKVLLHGVGHGEQMCLMAMPDGRGKPLDVTDGWRTA